MADKFEPYAREKTKVQPDSKFLLYCPFCDNWRLTDSMVARKKLGQHLTNAHTEEVRFGLGVKPPKIVDVD